MQLIWTNIHVLLNLHREKRNLPLTTKCITTHNQFLPKQVYTRVHHTKMTDQVHIITLINLQTNMHERFSNNLS